MKKVLVVIFSIIIFFIIFIGYKIIKTNQENNIPTIKVAINQRNFDLAKYITNSNDIKKDFPYSNYIFSGDYENYIFLKNDIEQLSNKLKDNDAAQSIMYYVLTDSLIKNKPALIQSNIDSLIATFQWVDKLRIYAEVDSINSNLYFALHDYWMSKLTDKLVVISNENSNIVYNFKFRYLLTKCNEVKYNASTIKNNSISKFIQNLLNSNWSHLFRQTWNQASMLQLSLLFIFVLITSLSYALLIKLIIKLFKKQ